MFADFVPVPSPRKKKHDTKKRGKVKALNNWNIYWDCKQITCRITLLCMLSDASSARGMIFGKQLFFVSLNLQLPERCRLSVIAVGSKTRHPRQEQRSRSNTKTILPSDDGSSKRNSWSGDKSALVLHFPPSQGTSKLFLSKCPFCPFCPFSTSCAKRLMAYWFSSKLLYFFEKGMKDLFVCFPLSVDSN